MDPWHIGPRLRYWRKRRGMTIEVLSGLLNVSPSKVQAAETGYRPFYRLDELLRVATTLQVDLGTFLCDPVPGVPDEDQQQLLLTLRNAFRGSDPRTGLTRLADRFAVADAGDDLMLVVLPGGQWQVVSRRKALKLGAALGVSLASPVLNKEQAGELIASLETRQVSRAGLGALRGIVMAYRRLDNEISAADLRPLVDHNIRIVKRLHAKSEDVRVGLGGVAAELDQLAGWLSFDMGDHAAATSHYRNSLKTADQVGDNMLAAHVLGLIGYQASYSGHTQEAVRATEAGLVRACKTPSRTLRAARAIPKAHAHARAGEAKACYAMLDFAEQELRAANRADDPEWMHYFGPWVVQGFRGIALTLLGQARQAEAALREALGQMDATHTRDRALFTSYLAVALAENNEIPEACRAGIEAADLLGLAYSPRVSGHLHALHARLRPHWSLPQVQELGDRLYAL